jgi:hypothetical protein
MSAAIYTAAVTLAQSDGAGRGDNPSEVGGVLLIVAVILLVILAVGSGAYLLARGTTRRRGERKQEPGREG